MLHVLARKELFVILNKDYSLSSRDGTYDCFMSSEIDFIP